MISRRQLTLLTLFLLMLIQSSCVSVPMLVSSSDPDKIIYKHPSGVFSITVPKNWGEPIPFRHDPTVFTFKPSRTAEFTVSVARNLNLPVELPMTAVTMMFPNETPMSPAVREKRDGWNSIRQDFEKDINGTTWYWLARFYGYKSNAVAITFNDTKEKIDQYRLIFTEVTDSIQFNR